MTLADLKQLKDLSLLHAWIRNDTLAIYCKECVTLPSAISQDVHNHQPQKNPPGKAANSVMREEHCQK